MPKTQSTALASNGRNRVRRPPTPPVERNLPDLAGRDFMTPAEVRGEAAYLVLMILLPRLPRPLGISVMTRAYADADSLGIAEVTNEVNALFSAIQYRKD